MQRETTNIKDINQKTYEKPRKTSTPQKNDEKPKKK